MEYIQKQITVDIFILTEETNLFRDKKKLILCQFIDMVFYKYSYFFTKS